MPRKEDVSKQLNKWISSLSTVPKGNKQKTIREQRLKFDALKSIKALSRHHAKCSSKQRQSIATHLTGWLAKPPSVEYHRACVELLLHVGDATAQKKCAAHIRDQISKETLQNQNNVEYLSSFSIRKPADPMDLYWLYLIGSSKQRDAICQTLWLVTFTHPWLRLIRSFVGLVEQGHGAQLYAPLVYRSFETRSHQALTEHEQWGWSSATALKIRRRLTRIKVNADDLLLSLLEDAPSYPVEPPFALAKKMMGMGVYAPPTSRTMVYQGNQNLKNLICEREGQNQDLYVPEQVPFSTQHFDACVALLRKGAHSVFAFYAARYLLRDPKRFVALPDLEQLVEQYSELLPAAAKVWMSKPTVSQKRIIKDNMSSLAKQGAGALYVAQAWAKKHRVSLAPIQEGALCVDAFYDVGTLSAMAKFIDDTKVTDGLLRHMVWGFTDSYQQWDARWLQYLEGVMCDTRLLYRLLGSYNDAFIAQIVEPYVRSLLENWEGDPDPELAFRLVRSFCRYSEDPELPDVIEEWLLQFVPKTGQSNQEAYLYWMTVLSAEVQGVDLPKLKKKLARKRDKSRFMKLAYLRFVDVDQADTRDEFYADALVMGIRYGHLQYRDVDQNMNNMDMETLREHLIEGGFLMAWPYERYASDEEKEAFAPILLEKYPEYVHAVSFRSNTLSDFSSEIREKIIEGSPKRWCNSWHWKDLTEHENPTVEFTRAMIRINAPKLVASCLTELIEQKESASALQGLFTEAIYQNRLPSNFFHSWGRSAKDFAYLSRELGTFFVSMMPYLLRTNQIDTYFWRTLFTHIDPKVFGASYILQDYVEAYPSQLEHCAMSAMAAENWSFYPVIEADLKECIKDEDYSSISYVKAGRNALLAKFLADNRTLRRKLESISLDDTDNPLYNIRLAQYLQEERSETEIVNVVQHGHFVDDIVRVYVSYAGSKAQALLFRCLGDGLDTDIVSSMASILAPYMAKYTAAQVRILTAQWQDTDRHFDGLLDLVLRCPQSIWNEESNTQAYLAYVTSYDEWTYAPQINSSAEFWFRQFSVYWSRNTVWEWNRNSMLDQMFSQRAFSDVHTLWKRIWKSDPDFARLFLRQLLAERCWYNEINRCAKDIISACSATVFFDCTEEFYLSLFNGDDTVQEQCFKTWYEKFNKAKDGGLQILLDLLSQMAEKATYVSILSSDEGVPSSVSRRLKALFENHIEEILPSFDGLLSQSGRLVDDLCSHIGSAQVWTHRTLLYSTLGSNYGASLVSAFQAVLKKERGTTKLKDFLHGYFGTSASNDYHFFRVLSVVKSQSLLSLLVKEGLGTSFCEKLLSSREIDTYYTAISKNPVLRQALYYAYIWNISIGWRNSVDTRLVSNRLSSYDELAERDPQRLATTITGWMSSYYFDRHEWLISFRDHFLPICIQYTPSECVSYIEANAACASRVESLILEDSEDFVYKLLYRNILDSNLINITMWKGFLEKNIPAMVAKYPKETERLIAYSSMVDIAPTEVERLETLSTIRLAMLRAMPVSHFQADASLLALPIWKGVESHRKLLLEPKYGIVNQLTKELLSRPNRQVSVIDIKGGLTKGVVTTSDTGSLEPISGTASTYYSYWRSIDLPFTMKVDGESYSSLSLNSSGGAFLLPPNTSSYSVNVVAGELSVRNNVSCIALCPWLTRRSDLSVQYWTNARSTALIVQWEYSAPADKQYSLPKFKLTFQLQLFKNGNIRFVYAPFEGVVSADDVPPARCGVQRFGSQPCVIAPLHKINKERGNATLRTMSKGQYPNLGYAEDLPSFSDYFTPSVLSSVPLYRLLNWVDVVDLKDHLKLRNIQRTEVKGVLHLPTSRQVLRLIKESPGSLGHAQSAIFAAMAWEHPDHVPVVEAMLSKLFSDDPDGAEAALNAHLLTSPQISRAHLKRIETLSNNMAQQDQLALWLTLMNGSLQDVALKRIETLTKDETFSSLYVIGNGGDIPELEALCEKLSRSLPKTLNRLPKGALQATHQWYPMILAADATSDMLLSLTKKLADQPKVLERLCLSLLQDVQPGQEERVCNHLQHAFDHLPAKSRGECLRVWVRAFIHELPEIRSCGLDLLNQVSKDRTLREDILYLLAIYASRKETYLGMHEAIIAHIQSSYRNEVKSLSLRSLWTMMNGDSVPAQEFALGWMKANVEPSSVSMRKWVDLASHDLLVVRQYAISVIENDKKRQRKYIEDTMRLLESSWDDTHAFGCRILEGMKSLDMGLVIRICDSNTIRVQEFGQRLLDRQISEHASVAVQLSEHPAQEVEGYVAQLIQEASSQSEAIDLEQLIPYFRRVLARVNKGRGNRDTILALIRKHALSSEQKARLLLPTIQWLGQTSVMRDKAHSLETCVLIQQTYPQINME